MGSFHDGYWSLMNSALCGLFLDESSRARLIKSGNIAGENLRLDISRDLARFVKK